jgi:hypothetical protein
MAITESHPARPGGGDPPTAGPPATRRRRRWRRPVLLGLGALFTVAVVVLAVLAGTYQPVQFGYSYGGAFPGLPTGTGIRIVDNFGGASGEFYVPPQSGVFSVEPSIFNNGPETVTIEAVSILSPQDQANIAHGVPPWPLVPAGQVHWRFQYTGAGQKGSISGSSVVGVSLPPGQGMSLGIPLKMSAICYTQGSWTGIDVIYVKERFLLFTHWVAVQFQPSLIMHQPESPFGEPGKDLVCPAGATK